MSYCCGETGCLTLTNTTHDRLIPILGYYHRYTIIMASYTTLHSSLMARMVISVTCIEYSVKVCIVDLSLFTNGIIYQQSNILNGKGS